MYINIDKQWTTNVYRIVNFVYFKYLKNLSNVRMFEYKTKIRIILNQRTIE